MQINTNSRFLSLPEDMLTQIIYYVLFSGFKIEQKQESIVAIKKAAVVQKSIAKPGKEEEQELIAIVAEKDQKLVHSGKYPEENDEVWQLRLIEFLKLKRISKQFIELTCKKIMQEIVLLEQILILRKPFVQNKTYNEIKDLLKGRCIGYMNINFSDYNRNIGTIKKAYKKRLILLDETEKITINSEIAERKKDFIQVFQTYKFKVFTYAIHVVISLFSAASAFSILMLNPSYDFDNIWNIGGPFIDYVENSQTSLSSLFALCLLVGAFIGSTAKIIELKAYHTKIAPKMYRVLLADIEQTNCQKLQILVAKTYLYRHPILFLLGLLCILALELKNVLQVDPTACVTQFNHQTLVDKGCFENIYNSKQNFISGFAPIVGLFITFSLYHIVDKSCRITGKTIKHAWQHMSKQCVWNEARETQEIESTRLLPSQKANDPIILDYQTKTGCCLVT